MDYDLKSSALYAILIEGISHKLPKGQVLQLSYERMMLNLVKSGYVKRYLITKDGTKSVQSIYGPEEIFPLTPVFKTLYNFDISHDLDVIYYEAMQPSVIYSVDQTSFQKSLDNNPMLYRDLLYVSGVRLNSNIQRLENMSLRAANRKVSHQLVYFADTFGNKTDIGTEIMIPLTHQNLADVLNLARETVSHCLTRLGEKGLIKADKQIIVIDVEKLRHSIG